MLEFVSMRNFEPDQRRQTRFKLETPVSFQVRGRPEFVTTLTSDISNNGLGFDSDAFIPNNTLIMLEVPVLAKVIHPVGRIAWSASMVHSDRYRIGVEFMEMDPAEKHYLKDYLSLKEQ